MPPNPNLYEKCLKSIYKTFSKDVGTTLVNLGAVGWLFSAVAQVTMIARNKNIDKKEKKFLIPQETADGIINVTLYYTICAGIKKLGDNLVEKGRFMTEKTKDFVMSLRNPSVSMEEYIKAIEEGYLHEHIVDPEKTKGRMTRFLKGTLSHLETLNNPGESIDYVGPLKTSIKDVADFDKRRDIIKQIPPVLDDFAKFKNVFGIISAVTASVVACNIITPVARNIAANHFQKKSLDKISKKEQLNKPKVIVNPVTSVPVYQTSVSKTFNTFKI